MMLLAITGLSSYSRRVYHPSKRLVLEQCFCYAECNLFLSIFSGVTLHLLLWNVDSAKLNSASTHTCVNATYLTMLSNMHDRVQ